MTTMISVALLLSPALGLALPEYEQWRSLLITAHRTLYVP